MGVWMIAVPSAEKAGTDFVSGERTIVVSNALKGITESRERENQRFVPVSMSALVGIVGCIGSKVVRFPAV